MPPRDAALATIRDAIKTRRFDGVYYICGEDEYRKADAVRQLVEAAIDPATRDFNHDVRRGNELDAESLESLVSTPPMMAERRVVVIRDVNLLRKDVRALLDRYVSSPSHDTLLLLVNGPGVKNDATLAKKATLLELESLDDNRLDKWISHRASELGATITPGAIDLLHEAVGNDLYTLAGEIDKLASYASGAADGATEGTVIDEAAVSAIVGIRRGETVTDLLDRVLEKNAPAAVELIPHVLLQPKTTAVSVVMGLATGMLAVGWGRAKVDSGFPSSRLGSEYYNLLKATKAYPGRSWGSASSAWAEAVRRWTTAECDRALDALLGADVALKESRVSDDAGLLESVVLAVCGAGQPAPSGR